MLLLGLPGVGKTHLAIGLGREAVRRDYTVPFQTERMKYTAKACSFDVA